MPTTPASILLTGAAGQLGTDVVLAAASRDDVVVHAFDRSELDVSCKDEVNETVQAVGPDVILHAGAFTAVDLCETERERAFAINAKGTEFVVGAASSVGARVVYVSTDYVFDGTKVGPYLEDDQPNPQSVYGHSKLAGEQALRAEDAIVRTSWVCGAHGANMVKTILRVAESHDTLTFVDDQIGRPSFTADLAAALLDMSTRPDMGGVFHLTNDGVASWYEFCGDVLEAAGLDRQRVKPCATHELQPPRPAPRPANSVLDSSRFAAFGVGPLRHYRLALADAVADLTS